MDSAREVLGALRQRVLSAREAGAGVWTGELSSSALSTALAMAALGDGDRAEDRLLARAGAAWLAEHGNADGGWGDTPASASNLSATLIAAAALRGQWPDFRGQRSEVGKSGVGARGSGDGLDCLARAEAWIAARVGGAPTPAAVAKALAGVYGKDRTFAAPILAFLAMGGDDPAAWRSVPRLPFLLALVPQRFYRLLRLQVVSYALPALIAVGLCRHVCAARARGGWPWGRLLAGPLLRQLARLQPSHGGFLDATPLTAFVCLSLRQAGYGGHAVAQKGLAFLRQAARADGSWAIDSNLRTWVTSLAARAVWGGGVPAQRATGSWKLEAGGVADAERVAAWLVKAQLKARHPYTGAAPGGWAWTDLPGGVPDADDTSGALLALRRLKDAGCRTDVSGAARNGVRWLLGLQNADGGMPTFCRGWGRLPFDRSCPDLSAHALAALAAWGDQSALIPKAAARLIRYLGRAQEADGSWVPLWFGHQEAEGGRNPVVGTARVVDALHATRDAWRESGVRGEEAGVGGMLGRGETWLLERQRADGGWSMGCEATVEETALAVTALAGGGAACAAAAKRGADWLAAQGVDGLARAAPIGLYFALLWYHERLYPLVWSLEALGACSETERG